MRQVNCCKVQLVHFLHRFGNAIRKQINDVLAEGELAKENNTHFSRVDVVKNSVVAIFATTAGNVRHLEELQRSPSRL